MRNPRPWLAVAFRRHEGLGLLVCGPRVRARLGKRAGVRPHRRLDAPTLSDPNSVVAFQSCVECDDILDLAAVDSAVANCSACDDEAMQAGLFALVVPRRMLRQRV